VKECAMCQELFETPSWQCPKCHRKPELVDGYYAFAPESARRSNGFLPDIHEELFRLEGSCFWFTGRNKLLSCVLDSYFPASRSLHEVGCGSGFVLAHFADIRPQMRLVGSDIYISALNLAKARVPHAELIQMDARKIPFVDEFDVVGAFDILEHMDDDLGALREIYKSVKPGGGIILTVPQHRWLWSKTDEIACHKRRYSRQELMTKTEGAGFRVQWISSFITLLLPLLFLSRLRFWLGVQKKGYKDVLGELMVPSALNAIFERICDLERAIISSGASFPVGGSLICVAKKE